MGSAVFIARRPARESSPPLLQWAALALRPLQALLAFPVWIFLAALTAMLFRPPDLKLYDLDRVALALLMFAVWLRAQLLRQRLRAGKTILLPLGALTVLAVGRALSEAYQPEMWSVLAAKWIVPCGLFYAARFVFRTPADLRQLEIFLLIVLGYLAVTAILFLAGNKSLIFPAFITDESLGIHADRARGPFLQAVANGVSLNLLGLIALDAYRRRRLPGAVAVGFLLAVPIAILATKTRAVWVSFGASVVVLLLFSPSPRVRRPCLAMVIAASLALLGGLTFDDLSRPIFERLEERSPVQFRMAVYRAGWEMFLARPLAGWGAEQTQPELARRISDFHQEEFYFHNTFLEIAVEYGLVGLGLYLWVLRDLWRLGARRGARVKDGGFLDGQFRAMWPVFLGAYLLNACLVVMNYQFVNGLVFTLAGILAAQNESLGERDGD